MCLGEPRLETLGHTLVKSFIFRFQNYAQTNISISDLSSRKYFRYISIAEFLESMGFQQGGFRPCWRGGGEPKPKMNNTNIDARIL